MHLKKRFKKHLRKIIFAFSILIVLLTVCLFFKPKPTNYLVEIKETGFTPSEISLKEGDSITFVNSGNWEHWPASNIHPSHEIYPEFDPKKSLQPGERWTFNFNKYGQWRFHDHVFSTSSGQVTVLENNSPLYKLKNYFNFRAINFADLSSQIQKIYFKIIPKSAETKLNNSNIFELVKNDNSQLKLLIDFVGPKKVMDKLLTQSNGGSTIDCHQEAHQIGRLSYEVSGASAFGVSDLSCHSGYLHGAMEAFLKKDGTINLSKKIDDLCNTFSTDFSNFECLHGVGHGVLAYEDYDMPKALSLCRSLKDSYSQSSCFGGVFMENVIVGEGRGQPGHSTKWVSDDPLFPCNGVDQSADIQTQCYMMQTSRMLAIYKYDFSKVAEVCELVQGGYKEICFQSYGRDVAGQVLRDPKKIQDYCDNLQGTNFQSCLRGALNVIVDFWGDKTFDQPHKLCVLQTSSESKSFCYGLIGTRLPQLTPDPQRINQICSLSESEYISSCLREAKLVS